MGKGLKPNRKRKDKQYSPDVVNPRRHNNHYIGNRPFTNQRDGKLAGKRRKADAGKPYNLNDKEMRKFLTGFSLTELMIVMVIFILVLGVVFGLLSVGQVSWESGSSKITVTQELRRGIEEMTKELSQAKISTISLVAGGSSNTISFQTARDLDGDGAISFSNGELEGLRASDPYVTYSLSYNASLGWNQLTRTVDSSSSVLGNYLTALQFARSSSTPTIINISASGEKRSLFGHLLSDSLNGRVILRN